jgi:dipeptidyl aminopeptidase/acylaminoacyl peptidase
MRGLIVGTFLLGVIAGAALAQTRGVLPQDYYRTTLVSDVRVSPPGTYVAFTVTTVLEERNKRHQEIWLQRLDRGRPAGAPFRFTSPTEESSAPRWSPDGTVLAFTSRRGDDRNTTWFARVTAPGGEAYHIGGVLGSPVWSPDGQWIAYTRAPGEADQGVRGPGGEGRGEGQREGWIAANAISHTLDAKRFDGRVITVMRYKRDGTLTLLPDPSIRKKTQLFLVAASGGEARQLSDLPFDVGGGGGGGGFGGGGSVVWSPDGRRIYFGANPEQDDEYNEENTQQIYLVDVAGGVPRAITTNPGSESSAAISPDGKQLAYVLTADRGSQPEIMVVALGADGGLAGEPKNLTADWDLIPESPTWSADGKTLRWEAGIGGNAHLFEAAAAGGSVRQVTTGDRQLNAVSWSGDGRLMAYTATDARTPAEVFVAQPDGRGETRVTSFNDAWLAETVRMPAERLTWRVKDGTEIEGWVVKPVGVQPGKTYPMVLKIHGGPYGAYGNTYFDTFHILSGAGMFVLYTNPRGSTGYGHTYQWATRGAWGEVDSEDYLTGVDAALAKYPEIDPKRLGVSGGSYGGYMTNWLSATTDRFAAAVTSRSIVNWEGWWGSSDAQGLTDYAFLGTPWEQRERYRRLSPISYVEHVTAPTLIIEGENDYRTPMGEGEQWFMSLKTHKVPVELVRYPRSSHGLSRTGEPWLLVDRLERIRSWFVHWLVEQPAADGGGS